MRSSAAHIAQNRSGCCGTRRGNRTRRCSATMDRRANSPSKVGPAPASPKTPPASTRRWRRSAATGWRSSFTTRKPALVYPAIAVQHLFEGRVEWRRGHDGRLNEVRAMQAGAGLRRRTERQDLIGEGLGPVGDEESGMHRLVAEPPRTDAGRDHRLSAIERLLRLDAHSRARQQRHDDHPHPVVKGPGIRQVAADLDPRPALAQMGERLAHMSGDQQPKARAGALNERQDLGTEIENCRHVEGVVATDEAGVELRAAVSRRTGAKPRFGYGPAESDRGNDAGEPRLVKGVLLGRARQHAIEECAKARLLLAGPLGDET